MTDKEQTFHLYSVDETQNFAKTMVNELPVGSVIALIGDLGTGKTTFTQGFAKGLGIDDSVGSPTFKLVSQYENGGVRLYHIDSYRLKNGNDLLNIGGEVYLNPENGFTLIEWANIIEDILPEETIFIHFDRVKENLNERVIKISGVSF